MPDGETVVWAADCASLCQVWSAKVGTGAARPVTRFRSRTAPLGGYDQIPLVAVGEDAVAYGRGRSVYLRPLAGGADARRVARFACPRKQGCSLSEIDYLAASPDGLWMIVAVTGHGCEVCQGSTPGPISERFAIRTDRTGATRLPLVAFWDLRFD